MATPKKKISVKAIEAAFRAENQRLGKRSLFYLPPKKVPDGKVVAHPFPDAFSRRVWVQFPTDDIELCACGSPLVGPVHYREKQGVKREIDALLSG